MGGRGDIKNYRRGRGGGGKKDNTPSSVQGMTRLRLPADCGYSCPLDWVVLTPVRENCT